MIPLSHYLIVGALLFAISVVGIFLNRKNLVIILMAIELLLLAANMNFVAFSHYLGNLSGQVFVFFRIDRGRRRGGNRARDSDRVVPDPPLYQCSGFGSP